MRFSKRAAILLAITFLLITNTSCSENPWYRGRLLVFNCTGRDLSAFTLVADGFEVDLRPAAKQQAAWVTTRANKVLAFRWKNAAGEEFVVSEPIEVLVPQHTRDDLIIEILGPGSMKVSISQLPERVAGLDRQ